MQGLPANYVNAGASLLHGGFVPGDMVFALKDIVVQVRRMVKEGFFLGCLGYPGYSDHILIIF